MLVTLDSVCKTLNLPLIKVVYHFKACAEQWYYCFQASGYVRMLQSSSPPQYVFWYHNDRMINYDTERVGVTVTTEVRGESTLSTLCVQHATSADSGNYTCRAPNTAQDTINVFVSKGRSTVHSLPAYN